MSEAYRTWDQLSELEQLESTYCELHKDVYGVKARWYRAKTVEQARDDLQALEAAAEEEFARQQLVQQQAIVRFEKLVTETIALGAGDRATALRWIHEGALTDGHDEFLCYHMGLPYGYLKKAA